MIDADRKYSRSELDEAEQTHDAVRLGELARHNSKFIRAQVAGNRYSPRSLREYLALDSSRGVIGWLIGNPSLTKEEFDRIFNTSQIQGYCSVITQALCCSKLADTPQLRQLAHERAWSIQIAILNNYIGRDAEYRKLISEQYLAKPDTKPKDWTEIEKLAYLRVYNSRLPPADNND